MYTNSLGKNFFYFLSRKENILWCLWLQPSLKSESNSDHACCYKELMPRIIETTRTRYLLDQDLIYKSGAHSCTSVILSYVSFPQIFLGFNK